MIKVFYDGWGFIYNIEEDRRVGIPIASSDNFFCLMADNERRLNVIGDAEIGVLGIVHDDKFCFLLTDEKGKLSPIEINKEKDIHKHPTNGNALKLLFDDDALPTVIEPTENETTVLHDDEPKEKPPRKVKPLEREANEGLLLIYEIFNHYSIEYLSDMSAIKAWNNITSKKFTSEYVATIAENKKWITLINDDRLNKSDFLEKYRKRFELVG